jgi:vacuolar-type H+-ATPase subunit H
MATTGPSISKSGRESLQRLVRQREKVLKSAAKQRSADLIADFENQIGQEYRFDQDETWERAEKLAQAVVDKPQKQAARSLPQIRHPRSIRPIAEPDLERPRLRRSQGDAMSERRSTFQLRLEAKSGADGICALRAAEIAAAPVSASHCRGAVDQRRRRRVRCDL